jgi:hypothetical protein
MTRTTVFILGIILSLGILSSAWSKEPRTGMEDHGETAQTDLKTEIAGFDNFALGMTEQEFLAGGYDYTSAPDSASDYAVYSDDLETVNYFLRDTINVWLLDFHVNITLQFRNQVLVAVVVNFDREDLFDLDLDQTELVFRDLRDKIMDSYDRELVEVTRNSLIEWIGLVTLTDQNENELTILYDRFDLGFSYVAASYLRELEAEAEEREERGRNRF